MYWRAHKIATLISIQHTDKTIRVKHFLDVPNVENIEETFQSPI